MAKFDFATVWRDIKTYRKAYILTGIASFGGYASFDKDMSAIR
jgi:SP family sugar:H+ symporter-like MFS transporter